MPIKEGDTFNSLQEFKEHLRRWAIFESWTPHILDSDKQRVRAGCRSAPDCPFRIRANYSASKRIVLITTCDARHTCFQSRTGDHPLHQNIQRSETGKLKFLLEEVPRLLDVTTDTQIYQIIDAIEQRFGQKIPIRQAQNVKTALLPDSQGNCRLCKRAGHTRRSCPLRPATPIMQTRTRTRTRLAFNGARRTSSNEVDMTSGESLPTVDPRLGSPTDVEDSIVAMSAAPDQEETPCSGVDAASIRPSDHVLSSIEQPASLELFRQRTEGSIQETAAETRLRASELMQRAASLMEQAAKLNLEAARLNASVADR